MIVTLTNCKSKLYLLGINMEEIGSGELFIKNLLSKVNSYLSWEYNFDIDELKIKFDDDTVIPDLSSLGEVVPNDSFN